MNIQTAFPSKYLKAADLGKARPVVTIAKVAMEDVGDDHRPVVYFQGKDRTLVLNKTNANMIEEIAGTPETDSWRGVAIVLYASKTDYGGKRVDCIRVDTPPPSAQYVAASPTTTQGRLPSLPPMPAPLPAATSWTSTATLASQSPYVGDSAEEPLTDTDIPF